MAAQALPAATALNLTMLATEVHRGLPARALSDLLVKLDMSQAALATALGIPERTLHRRMKSVARLTLSESERVARLTRLFYLAEHTLGSEPRARAWLESKPKALGGRTPLEFAATEPGARVVEQLLGRLEHGVFS
ncbi:MAG: DUF2384 domain-containing protein [Deltaproteobacteria bacterium]|nr:DUF2384 domain-containing protein [Deltaproteobacteria bacterium]